MNHRPFEDWLLENEPLTPEQKQELKTHLKTCTTCIALTEVDLALKSPRMVTPAAGFTDRFQARLAAEHKLRHKRQLWGLGLLGVLVLLALGITIFQLFSVILSSPAQIFFTWISWWISLVTSVRTYASIGLVLIKTIAGIIPLPLWLGMAGASFLLILVWVASLWKLSYSSHARRLA
jgi:hypothetical protein